MNKVSETDAESNWLNVNSQDELYVGLDVHKKNIHAAFWLNGSIIKALVMPPQCCKVVAKLEGLKLALRGVVYEAGPTGYSLARALHRAGLPVSVVAPSQIPRPSKRGAKSDSLDCRALAELAAARMLRSIPVPSKQEEADRQLVRHRDTVVGKRSRVKQQIKSFLLQHGLPIPTGCWSLRGLHCLRVLELCSELRFCLDELLLELEHYSQALKRVDAQLRKLALETRHRRRFGIACSHPGVGKVLSMSYLTELFALDRIGNRCALASTIGLAPMVRQSGESIRSGPIIKAGKPKLRAKLVECSWTWVRLDAYGRYLYNRYRLNTGSAQKAIVAVARRLSINLWAMLRDGRQYEPALKGAA